jgi:toxin HigB-1
MRPLEIPAKWDVTVISHLFGAWRHLGQRVNYLAAGGRVRILQAESFGPLPESAPRSVAIRVITVDTSAMIKTFADRETLHLYIAGASRRFPADIWNRATRKLGYLNLTTRLNDLKAPPSNRLHALERDRKGQHSISVNDQ